MGINRKGQALVELAIGVVAIVIVVSAITELTYMIVANLNGERELRAEAGKKALNSLQGGLVPIYCTVNSNEGGVNESVSIPAMSGLK